MYFKLSIMLSGGCYCCCSSWCFLARVQPGGVYPSPGCTCLYGELLRWFGHVSRDSKTDLHGTVKGKRRASQKKRWEDNINERTGIYFVSSTRAAEKQD